MSNTLVVFGSRGITPHFDLLDALSYTHNVNFARIISGGARGVDRAAEMWAASKDHEFGLCPADWDTYGKRAGFIRNVEMAREATHGIAVWDGKSAGTQHMLDTMIRLGKPVAVYIEGA